MRSDHVRCRAVIHGGMYVVVGMLVAYLFQVVGCIHGDCWPTLRVRGKLLDTNRLEGATDAAIGGRAFSDGEVTDFVPPFIYDGSPAFPPPEEDGRFLLAFTSSAVLCSLNMPGFPRPDRIEIIVARGDCQYTFSIDINEDTVVDMTFPDDTLELKDPILVPPCDLESGGLS